MLPPSPCLTGRDNTLYFDVQHCSRPQVGQCGNQIGCRFWELALREHAAYNTKGRFDEALSSFFKNVDSRREPAQLLPVGDGTGA